MANRAATTCFLRKIAGEDCHNVRNGRENSHIVLGEYPYCQAVRNRLKSCQIVRDERRALPNRTSTGPSYKKKTIVSMMNTGTRKQTDHPM